MINDGSSPLSSFKEAMTGAREVQRGKAMVEMVVKRRKALLDVKELNSGFFHGEHPVRGIL